MSSVTPLRAIGQPSPAIEMLLEARFRSNPAFDLRRFDQLAPEQRTALADLEQSELDAVLLPREPESSRTAKVIDPDTAALLDALRQPNHLPKLPGERTAAELARPVATLVLDDVLQIESAGRFVGGPRAHPLLFGTRSRPEGGGRLAALSLGALRYAQALPLRDARRLAHRLYAYNQVPIHPRWQERFGGPARVEAALGLGPYGHDGARLAADYEPDERTGWRSWSLGGNDPDKLRYKLYVSPHPDSLTPAFHASVESFVELGVRAFKVGRGLLGLLRPDKIVAYFESYGQLEQVVRILAPRLASCRPQGVPFSAELTRDGMLSWGIDPSLDPALIQWRGLESWRMWISNQLATALLQAQAEPAAPVEPWRFALDRLRLQGVDAETWAPATIESTVEASSW